MAAWLSDVPASHEVRAFPAQRIALADGNGHKSRAGSSRQYSASKGFGPPEKAVDVTRKCVKAACVNRRRVKGADRNGEEK
jgi:predicted aminopeptidase